MNFRHVNLDIFCVVLLLQPRYRNWFRLVENPGANISNMFSCSPISSAYAFPGTLAYHYQGNDARFDLGLMV